MDSVTPVDDAAPARSRPLTESQAEMQRVPNPDDKVKMRMHKSFGKHFFPFPFLWITMHLLSSVSCTSLERVYILEPFNASSSQSNFSNPTNLSELIEYSPISLEDDLKNWEKGLNDAKTFDGTLSFNLKAQNDEKDNETGVLDQFGGIGHLKVSETPLSEIEFNHSSQSNFSIPTNVSVFKGHWSIHEEDLKALEQRPKPNEITKMTLRINLTVHNYEKDNETVVLDKFDGIMHPNASETPLSEIEFKDNPIFLLTRNPFSKREARTLSVDNKTDIIFDTDEELKNSGENSLNDIHLSSSESDEDLQTGRSIQLSKYARGRQFAFAPYMPASQFAYDKDTPPDEKISFHDVLPVKAVKFIKSMVEDADWNGMFKSMVRTVVDHFVNKIIEKMFSEKDQLLKKRSLDDSITSAWTFPSLQRSRLKRATNTNNPTDQIKDIFSMPPKRARQELGVNRKKTAQERMSWFDHFLDYVFPNENADKSDYDSTDERLKKRDTANSEFLKIIFELFEKSSEFIKDTRDVLRLKMLKEFLPYIHKYDHSSSSSNYADAMKMSHRNIEKNVPHNYDVANYVSARSMRKRRSTRDYFRKMEDRLWQLHSHKHRPHSYSSREDCSLRKACNAGRLLARFPSIQDIAVQLRSNGNEPHWDALIWGMKKKGCSRVFCKRRRSPKGSKNSWNSEKERLTKRILFVTEPPETFSDTDDNFAV